MPDKMTNVKQKLQTTLERGEDGQRTGERTYSGTVGPKTPI